MRRTMFFPLAFVALGVACAPAGPSNVSSQAQPAQSAQPARTLVVAVSDEPKTLAARLIGQVGSSAHFRRMFNADLALLDDQSNPYPYLAEALPQLNTGSWKVFPDGTMETTYRLKPNLVWQDGTPLTADDFVFSWQMFATPDLGQSRSLPFGAIANVEAADNRTILIRWPQPYAQAGALQSLGSSALQGLPPLPRAILGPTLESESAQALINHPYWSTEYVGVGPYRLDRWEPGAFIEASAFDRHALGIARIQNIKMVFRTDANAGLASMLSGEAQFAANLPLEQAITIMREWPAGRGSMVPYFNSFNAAHFQGRPDLLSPSTLQDRRVRQALAHAVDRTGLNAALYEGQNLIADSIFAPTSELGQAANAAATKYPFDPGRSAQLMTEAGFIKPPAGDFYIGPGGQRFSADLRGSAGPEDEAATSAIASGWRQAGFAFTESVLPRAQARDVEAKSSYPGLLISQTSGGEGGINGMGTAQIPGPENQWRGNAWDGYSNPEMDRLIAAFVVTIQPAERTVAAMDIVRLYTSDLPVIPLFFPVSPHVFTSDLSGPKLRPASSNVTWNIHEWEFR